MELESFNIQFEHIKGQNNVFADTLSHLIDIDPDTQLTPEGNRHEFGYAVCLRNFQTFTHLRLMKSLQVTKKSKMTQTYEMPCSALTTQLHLND